MEADNNINPKTINITTKQNKTNVINKKSTVYNRPAGEGVILQQSQRSVTNAESRTSKIGTFNTLFSQKGYPEQNLPKKTKKKKPFF